MSRRAKSGPGNPRARLGILSAEPITLAELTPSMNAMSQPEITAVLGNFDTLRIALYQRIKLFDPWHPLHDILKTGQELLDSASHQDDVLLDAKETAERLGYSTRWLYHHADSLGFAVRQTSGRLRFSRRGLEKYLKSNRRTT